jgi:tight adherence protein B
VSAALLGGLGVLVSVALARRPVPSRRPHGAGSPPRRVDRPLGPTPAGGARWRRRRRHDWSALADALADAVRSGATVRGAPALVAERAPVHAAVLEPVVRALDHGAGLAGSLAAWRCHPDPDARALAGALAAAVEVGGSATETLAAVAAGLRDRHEARAQAGALAVQARLSALVVALSPFGFLALVGAGRPDVLALLVTPGPGLACALAGVGLTAAGWAWMRRLVREATAWG